MIVHALYLPDGASDFPPLGIQQRVALCVYSRRWRSWGIEVRLERSRTLVTDAVDCPDCLALCKAEGSDPLYERLLAAMLEPIFAHTPATCPAAYDHNRYWFDTQSIDRCAACGWDGDDEDVPGA